MRLRLRVRRVLSLVLVAVVIVTLAPNGQLIYRSPAVAAAPRAVLGVLAREDSGPAYVDAAAAALAAQPLDGSDWHQLAPSVSPPARAQEAIAYDPIDDYVVIYSGFIHTTAYNDTWTYHAGVWTNLTATAGGPGARRSALMVWDAADGYILMFGGSNGPYLNDTWSFLHGHWTQIPAVNPPPIRRSYGMAYDPVDQEVVLFGGHQDRPTPQSDFVFLNDTWTYRHGVWTSVTSSTHPSSRAEPNVAWDGSDGCVLLFGGYASSKGGAYGDTWTFRAGSWTNHTANLSGESTPPRRDGAGLDNVAPEGYVLMFGGHSGGAQYNDTWVFSGLNWSQLEPEHGPAPISGDRLSWDPADGYVLMFGGDIFATGWQNVSWAFFAPQARFVESGLPAGSAWTVVVDENPHSANGSQIVVPLDDGIVAFTIAPIPGFVADAWNGSVSVENDVVTVSISFSVALYEVSFESVGLAGGLWNVSIAGSRGSAPAGVPVGFNLTNGSYTYLVGTFLGLSTNESGYVTVNGSPVNVLVPFTNGTRYAVMLTESGLATDAWSAGVSGTLVVSESPRLISLNLTNGSYEIIPTPVLGFVDPPSFQLVVNGSWVNATVAYVPAGSYGVEFDESGLPAQNWSVTIGTESGTGILGGAITFTRPNGSWTYTVGGESGFQTNWSGTVLVDGANVSVPVKFVPFIYSVQFVESGLTSGSWSVTLNGTTRTAPAALPIQFDLPNGSFAYSPGTVSGFVTPPASFVNVSGASRTVPLLYSPRTFAVFFNETGLSGGTPWSVTLGTAIASSTTASIRFQETNGSYSYRVGSVAGFTTKTSGTVHVAGKTNVVSVHFTAVRYSVAFTESGLASGTKWQVTVGSTRLSSTSSTITTSLANGSYSYSVGHVSGFTAQPASGTLRVAGSSARVSIVFSVVQFNVTFTEQGLPAGTSWNITIGLTTHSSTGTTIVFALASGTYNYVVGPVSNFTSPSNGSVTVGTKSVAVSIKFVGGVEPPLEEGLLALNVVRLFSAE